MVTHNAKKFISSGLTLVELICVLVVISLLSITMLLKTDSATSGSVSNQVDVLRRDLTHIQSLNLAYGIPLRLNVSSSSYNVTCVTAISPCTTVGDKLLDPTTGQKFSRDLPSGVTMTANNSLNVAANTIDFDSLGRPSVGSLPIATNPVRTFAFTGASKTSYVYLRPITGLAEVSY